jgi:hypothetical protein
LREGNLLPWPKAGVCSEAAPLNSARERPLPNARLGVGDYLRASIYANILMEKIATRIRMKVHFPGALVESIRVEAVVLY